MVAVVKKKGVSRRQRKRDQAGSAVAGACPAPTAEQRGIATEVPSTRTLTLAHPVALSCSQRASRLPPTFGSAAMTIAVGLHITPKQFLLLYIA